LRNLLVQPRPMLKLGGLPLASSLEPLDLVDAIEVWAEGRRSELAGDTWTDNLAVVL